MTLQATIDIHYFCTPLSYFEPKTCVAPPNQTILLTGGGGAIKKMGRAGGSPGQSTCIWESEHIEIQTTTTSFMAAAALSTRVLLLAVAARRCAAAATVSGTYRGWTVKASEWEAAAGGGAIHAGGQMCVPKRCSTSQTSFL